MKRIFTVAFLVIAALSVLSINVCAQSESRDDVLKQIETKRAELSALEKKFLTPSEEDRAAYAAFLGQPDTGLIRLLPREVYGNNDDKNKKSLTFFVRLCQASLCLSPSPQLEPSILRLMVSLS